MGREFPEELVFEKVEVCKKNTLRPEPRSSMLTTVIHPILFFISCKFVFTFFFESIFRSRSRGSRSKEVETAMTAAVEFPEHSQIQYPQHV